jgi:DHA1 family bicyclomycin/chloramphenicol resistance-like MFS transporter
MLPSRRSAGASGDVVGAGQVRRAFRRQAMPRARLILILGALSAFAPLSIDLYLPALPAIGSDLRASTTLVQLSITACVFGIAFGQLVMGPLSDAYGRRTPLLIGIAGYILASLACALSGGVGVLITVRFVQGFAGGTGIVIARAIARDLYKGALLARLYAMLMLVSGSAPILGPLAGGQLLRYGGWRDCFYLLAVIGFGLLVASAVALPRLATTEVQRSRGISVAIANYRTLATDRSYVSHVLAASLAFGAVFVYVAESPFVLESVYRLSPQQFSLVFGANAFGIMLIGQSGARLVGRVSPRALLVAGLAGSLAGALLLFAAVNMHAALPFVLGAIFLIVASMGLILPNASALAMAEHGKMAGSASAGLGLGQFLVGGLAAPIAGLVPAPAPLAMGAVITCFSSLAGLALAVPHGMRTGGKHTDAIRDEALLGQQI